MGFVYETLDDFIQRVVVKPQLFFAWAKKSVPRLICPCLAWDSGGKLVVGGVMKVTLVMKICRFRK